MIILKEFLHAVERLPGMFLIPVLALRKPLQCDVNVILGTIAFYSEIKFLVVLFLVICRSWPHYVDAISCSFMKVLTCFFCELQLCLSHAPFLLKLCYL